MYKYGLIYLLRILTVAGLMAYSFVPMPGVAASQYDTAKPSTTKLSAAGMAKPAGWGTTELDAERAFTPFTRQMMVDLQGMPAPAGDNPLAPAAIDISINDPAAVVEGNSGTRNMNFTVTPSGITGQQMVTVNYTITAVTATRGVDFIAASMTGSFPFDNKSQPATITVQVIGDLLDENNETLTVTIGSPDPNVNFSKSVGTGTIQDDDTASVSIADASITEANATLSFPVTVDITSTFVITVPYNTQNLSATAGQDYTAASGSLVFQPGQRSKTIPVTIFDDQIDEGASETFQVNLGTPVNAGLTDGQAIGTIIDNDTASLNVSPANLTLREGGPTSPVQINLGSQPLSPVRIIIQPNSQMVVDRTVITLTNGTYSTGETVNASAFDDTLPECTQSGQLQITTTSSDALYNNLSKTIPAAITDNDTKCITISDLSVTEGDTGNQTVTFIITGTGYIAASVNYAITPVTASTPQDYTATAYSGTLSFAQTDTTKQVQASVNGDRLDENNETFKVVLSGGSNVTIQKSEGIATIIDDDTAQVSVADASILEANATLYFTVTLDITNTLPVTINYKTNDGPAPGGATGSQPKPDFVAVTNGSLVLSPGTRRGSIPITINDDNIAEGTETFTVELTNVTNAQINDGLAVGTIIDNDIAGLQVNPTTTLTVTEGSGSATFEVWLESEPKQDVTVNFNQGSQLLVSPSSWTFTDKNYAAHQVVTVTAFDDKIAEGPHTGTITLSTQTNDNDYKNLTKTVTSPIVDDDVAGVELLQYGSVLDEAFPSLTITYTLRLTSEPTTTVTVTPLPNLDYSFNPTFVTFSSSDWTNPKTITISVVEDQVDEDTESLPLSHIVSSQARFYNSSLVVPPGTVTVSDNDTAGLTLSLSGVEPLITSESGATNAFSVTLLTQPVYTVTLELTSLDPSEGLVLDPYTWLLTFNPGNWNQPQRVTVLGVDDLIDDFNQPYTVMVRSVSPDGKYMDLIKSVLFINQDNDGPGISVLDASAPEDHDTMVFTVQLSAPTDQDVVLHYETRDMTAKAGLDYDYITGTLTIPKFESSGMIAVGLLNDTLGDFDEKFQLLISGPTTADAVITRAIAYGTITNDGDIGYIYLPNIQRIELKFADLFNTALAWSVIPETGSSAVVQNGQYVIRHTKPDRNVRSVAPASAVTLGNVYAIETYAQATPGALPSTRYGLLFDWIDSVRFYRFLINPVTQEYWLYVFNNGWTVLQTGTSDYISTTGFNLLRIERRNANVRAYVNNELVINTNNSIFQGGRVGLTILTPTSAEGMCDGSLPGCTVYAEAAFDYFFVYAISP